MPRQSQSPLRQRKPAASAPSMKVRPALTGLTGSHPESQVVKVKVNCAEDGSSYGLALSNRSGFCFVEYVQGPAEAAGEVKALDRVSHVAGDGPLGYDAVVAALKKIKPNPVDLVLVRGERPPPPGAFKGSGGPLTGVLLLGLLACSAAAVFIDPEQFVKSYNDSLESSLFAAGQEQAGHWMTGEAYEASRAAGGGGAAPQEEGTAATPAGVAKPPTAKPPAAAGSRRRTLPPSSPPPKAGHLVVGGDKYSVTEEGVPLDPDGMRNAMKADRETMSQLRQNKPEWAKIVLGNPDGTYNKVRFEQMIKENVMGARQQESLALNEDGTAKMPERYIAYLKAEKGRKFLKGVKKDAPEVYEKLMNDDVDALQGFLKQMRMQRDQEKLMEQMPPNPPTPYDDIGKVGMSMRILTDEGEEKDLYQLAADETEEEKWTMPPYLLCPACQAVTFQAAKTIATALEKKYNDELPGVVTIDALQSLCRDGVFWAHNYGVVPTKSGQNYIEGDGVAKPEHGDLTDMGDVMLAKMHKESWGGKIGMACERYVLGAEDLDIDDFVRMSHEETKKKSDNYGAKAFQEALCYQPEQICSMKV